ncbi:hypothetical protein AB0P02_06785 [Streptomyces griseoluteus]|uniref:hypothetical protein n=1 Tax=Streptomyces griseoluteus TaxID=29306 RepID=UPI00343CA9E7
MSDAHEPVPHIPPVDLPDPVTDLFAAIGEALNLPIPSTDPADDLAYHVLLVLRSTHVRILLESLVSHPDVSLHRDAADVRAYIEKNPVTYTTFEQQKAAAKRAGEDQ